MKYQQQISEKDKKCYMYCIYLKYLVASISKVGTYLIFIQKFKHTLRTSDISKPDIIMPCWNVAHMQSF